MKLELKHLAGYLPYKLRAEMLDYKRDYVGKQYDTIIGFHQWDSRDLYWSALTIGGSKPELNSIKPILHPLSDLTKEIEVNGEKFVPIDKIAIYGSEYYLIEQIKTGMVEVIIWQMLLEWHFDIYGLIEKSLAIDINEL